MTARRASGGQRTAAARQAAFVERRTREGLVRIAVWVPDGSQEYIRAEVDEAVERWRKPGAKMNEHAMMIKRIDADLEKNASEQERVWIGFSKKNEFGDAVLTASGKRQMEKLVKERKDLEEKASAAYRM